MAKNNLRYEPVANQSVEPLSFATPPDQGYPFHGVRPLSVPPVSRRERNALRDIAEEADAILVDDQVFLLLPTTPDLLATLAAFEAGAEDMEDGDDPIEDGDPREDDDPPEDTEAGYGLWGHG